MTSALSPSAPDTTHVVPRNFQGHKLWCCWSARVEQFAINLRLIMAPLNCCWLHSPYNTASPSLLCCCVSWFVCLFYWVYHFCFRLRNFNSV